MRAGDGQVERIEHSMRLIVVTEMIEEKEGFYRFA